MVAGGFERRVNVRVADMSACRRFLGDALSRVPGIGATRSYAVMAEVSDARALDLAHLRADAPG